MLTAEEIKALICEGGGVTWISRSKVRVLLQEVCVFANSKGGYLLIDVDDDGRIAGTSINNDKRSAIQNSIRDIFPLLSVEIYLVIVDGKEVWVIYIPSGKRSLMYFPGRSIYAKVRTFKSLPRRSSARFSSPATESISMQGVSVCSYRRCVG